MHVYYECANIILSTFKLVGKVLLNCHQRLAFMTNPFNSLTLFVIFCTLQPCWDIEKPLRLSPVCFPFLYLTKDFIRLGRWQTAHVFTPQTFHSKNVGACTKLMACIHRLI